MTFSSCISIVNDKISETRVRVDKKSYNCLDKKGNFYSYNFMTIKQRPPAEGASVTQLVSSITFTD